jgi:hypothetical protein
MNCSSSFDNVFGPQYCESFDFTLVFEQSFFQIVPCALLLLVIPFRASQLRRQEVKCVRSWAYFCKQAVDLGSGPMLSVDFLGPFQKHQSDRGSSGRFVLLRLLWPALALYSGAHAISEPQRYRHSLRTPLHCSGYPTGAYFMASSSFRRSRRSHFHGLPGHQDGFTLSRSAVQDTLATTPVSHLCSRDTRKYLRPNCALVAWSTVSPRVSAKSSARGLVCHRLQPVIGINRK